VYKGNCSTYLPTKKDNKMIIADYTATKKFKQLDISHLVDGQRILISRHNVTGKVDARRLAISLNAKPWNF
jgi:hypothetical protein